MISPARVIASLLVFSCTQSCFAQEEPHDAEVAAFAGKITGGVWRFRGTRNVKGVLFDGSRMRAVRMDGGDSILYETMIFDAGVVRIGFSESSSGWLAFTDDLRFVTAAMPVSEATFAAAEGEAPVRINNFPEDLKGRVFAAPQGGAVHPITAIQWNGDTLEFSVVKDSVPMTEHLDPVIATRNVFEVNRDGSVFWLVYRSDGKFLELLGIDFVFGGHGIDVPASSRRSAEETGLSEQDNDLESHLVDLVDAGVRKPASTLLRSFERRLSKSPELLNRLKTRINVR